MITFLAKKLTMGYENFFQLQAIYNAEFFSAKHFKLVYNHKIIGSSSYDHVCLLKANESNMSY